MQKYVLYLLLFFPDSLYAQKSMTWTVKAGEKISDIVPASELFSYPEFRKGTVYFKDGKTAVTMLNYSMLTGFMQFIDEKKDTLDLVNHSMIRMIVIAQDSIIVQNGYWKAKAKNPSYLLIEKPVMRQYLQKGGSYGVTSSTSATESVSTLVEHRNFNISTEQEVLIMKTSEYGIATKSGQIIFPDKKRLQKYLTKHKSALNGYLATNSVTANNRSETEKLVEFLGALGN